MTEQNPMGVDLGTTNTCVAILESTGPRVLTHNYDDRIFPSTSSINRAVWHVGKHSITSPRGEDVQFFHDVKRILGRNSQDGLLEEDIERWHLPFELDDDGYPYCLVGVPPVEIVRPIELWALNLLKARKIAEDATGKKVTSCVITVPAYFTDSQRRATRDAAKIAQIEVCRILNEPTAVAVAYLSKLDVNGQFFVLDAGGGTIDCSKVRVSTSHDKKTFVVEATSGDNALGGNDFLHILTKMLSEQVDGVPYEELMPLCEAAKMQSDDSIIIQVRGKSYEITQGDYKKRLEPNFRRLRALIKKALEGDTPDGVIITGGSSCQRLFDEFVSQVFRNMKILPRRPAAEVVAEGAAIMAGSVNIVVTEVLSRSLGIDIQDKAGRKVDIMDVVLKRNTPLPTSKKNITFFAVEGEETEIKLYEGEHTKSSKNILLGSFVIETSAGQEIKMAITVTRNSEVFIKATTAQNSKELDVKRKSELTDEELQEMAEKAQRRFASIEVVNKAMASKRRRKRY